MTRKDDLKRLSEIDEIDVLIIGAGVNGIGTFRDLAHQGINVLMVERADFAGGASAASSHMLHGGIRYLENGEFRLVREALTERNLMLRNAPHYSKPLPTTIPIFSWFSGIFNAPFKFLGLMNKPAERGALVIKIGLIFYDFFARSYKVMPNHELMFRERALKEFPKVSKDVKCIARYYDGYMPYPERICMELVMDGEAAHDGAIALNYVSAADAKGETVVLRDELTGDEYTVKPKVVINAAGPWIDFANRNLGKDTNFIGGTKGSHIIVDHPELYEAVGGGEFFFENDDGRIVLLLPYVDGTIMIGTTDIRIENPDDAVCTEEEIDYMLGLVDRVFPTIKVERDDIVFAFSGVRPLPASDKGYTGNVSRDHSIKVVEPDKDISFPILSLVGGKWTTFRAFSEQTADRVLERLGKARKTSTADMKLGGGVSYPMDEAGQQKWIADLASRTNLDEARVKQLFERYGTYAEQVAMYMVDDVDAMLTNTDKYSKRELMFLIESEKVQRLDDLVLRRTLMAWLGGFTDALLLEVADIMADTLDWSDEKKAAEVIHAAKVLSEEHRLNLSVPVASS